MRTTAAHEIGHEQSRQSMFQELVGAPPKSLPIFGEHLRPIRNRIAINQRPSKPRGLATESVSLLLGHVWARGIGHNGSTDFDDGYDDHLPGREAGLDGALGFVFAPATDDFLAGSPAS